jgi:hypothetical protein
MMLCGLSDLTSQIAQYTAQMEGWGKPGVWATINNNPGNVRSCPGQIGTAGGFAVMPSAAAGWVCLDNETQRRIDAGATLQEFYAGYPLGCTCGVNSSNPCQICGYAPAADANNPLGVYAPFVASNVGIPVDVPLDTLESAPSNPSSTNLPTYQPSIPVPSPSLDLTSILGSGDATTVDSSVQADTSTGMSGSTVAVLAAVGIGVLLLMRSRG